MRKPTIKQPLTEEELDKIDQRFDEIEVLLDQTTDISVIMDLTVECELLCKYLIHSMKVTQKHEKFKQWGV